MSDRDSMILQPGRPKATASERSARARVFCRVWPALATTSLALAALGAFAALATTSGCGAEEGAGCAVDSDCSGGMWCDRRVSMCVEPICDGDFCALPPLPSADVAGPDGGNPDASVADSASKDTATDPDSDAGPAGERISWIVTAIAVGETGTPGDGLDVDGNASSCAPFETCSDGIDNAFAGLAGVVNGLYTDAVEKGELQLGVILTDSTGGALRLVFVEPGAEDGDWVETAASRVDGDYRTELLDVRIDGDDLVAPGGGRWQVPLIVFGELLQVSTVIAKASGKIDGEKAVVTWAGAIRIQDFEAAVIEYSPDVLDLVSSFYEADLDLDHDGTVDAISIGWITELQQAPISAP